MFARMIDRNHLKAASYCMAKNDVVRYCLNGVLFTRNANGQSALVSTDGYILFAGLLGDDDNGNTEINCIIPSDVIKKESKGKAPAILRQVDDTQWALGDTLFTPLDAKYPDWQRITPRKLSGVLAQYNADNLAKAQAALNSWHGSDMCDAVQHNGNGAGLMAIESAYVVIMPYLTTAVDCKPFTWNATPQIEEEALAA